MIRFDELRITDDKNMIVIECHVEDYDIYDEMYIKSIYLEYYKNRVSAGTPSDKAVEMYYDEDGSAAKRAIRVTLPIATLPADIGTDTFDRGLFYVYVNCDGNLSPSVATMQCGYDNTLDIGVILDWQFLYFKGMNYVANFAAYCNPCSDSTDFENYILLWNAIKFAVDTCDWVQLERLWPAIVDSTSDFSIGGCGCNG